MLSFLKQSTVADVIIGPFVDDTDFKTTETALTIEDSDIQLSKNGGTAGDKNDTSNASHIANGCYKIDLNATDTNTVGELHVSVKVTGALVVVAKFVVLEEAIYDALFGASAAGFDSNARVVAASLVGHTVQTGDSYARLGGPAGASVSADIAAVKTVADAVEVDTQDIQTQVGVAGAGLTAVPWNATWDAEVESEATDALNAWGKTGFSLAADQSAVTIGTTTDVTNVVSANLTQIEGHALAGTGTQIADGFEYFFDVATPAKDMNDVGGAGGGGDATAANQATIIGYLDATSDIDTNIDTLLTRLSAARAGYLDALNVSGTLAHSDAAATYKADVSALATSAALTTVEGKIDTVDANVDLVLADTGTDGVKLDTTQSGAWGTLLVSAGQIITGTVDTVTNTHTPTTTEFQADDVTESTSDHYNGRIVIFTSGSLAGQATDITDYASVGGIGQFTVTAMTEAPSNNDTFIIV